MLQTKSRHTFNRLQICLCLGALKSLNIDGKCDWERQQWPDYTTRQGKIRRHTVQHIEVDLSFDQVYVFPVSLLEKEKNTRMVDESKEYFLYMQYIRKFWNSLA